jgi:hypothetical protein
VLWELCGEDGIVLSLEEESLRIVVGKLCLYDWAEGQEGVTAQVNGRVGNGKQRLAKRMGWTNMELEKKLADYRRGRQITGVL